MYNESPVGMANNAPGYSPGVEQHHSLLPPGGAFSSVPTSAAHLAEQMETGGAKIEATLMRLNCKHQTLFFVASWGVILASSLDILGSILRLQLPNLINAIFLLLFGFVTSILDIPGSPRWAARYRQLVRKYIRFLTRLTGKSLWFLYLGSIIAVTVWPSRYGAHGNVLLVFVAVGTSLLVVGVAIIGLFIAFRKSLRLERVRKALQVMYKGNSPEVYRKYAITDPSHGMQFEEFNRMCADHSQGKLQFDIGDLGIIYNALDEHQKSAINEREFSEWMAGP
eukprot:CAMPEP_0113846722 /NCGR_PEP_ID=MMETSP0372-20130328/1466_1 /TAXON_ID=340204 /ORGANISM="Lankesteria abbotti" /LENGTH=280 /DNA_ID=CAMNT_0000815899 /DNA_START=80 /DNA_END=919 /DNA_ORIENTATION=- /assembly_acc=CAM_ASM_000359